MDIKVDNSVKPSFGISVSNKFVGFTRSYFNRLPNRLKNNNCLNIKLEQYKTFGYDQYTIELHNRPKGTGVSYYLVASKNDEPNNKIILGQKYSFRYILIEFLSMTKMQLEKRIENGKKFCSR